MYHYFSHRSIFYLLNLNLWSMLRIKAKCWLASKKTKKKIVFFSACLLDRVYLSPIFWKRPQLIFYNWTKQSSDVWFNCESASGEKRWETVLKTEWKKIIIWRDLIKNDLVIFISPKNYFKLSMFLSKSKIVFDQIKQSEKCRRIKQW